MEVTKEDTDRTWAQAAKKPDAAGQVPGMASSFPDVCPLNTTASRSERSPPLPTLQQKQKQLPAKAEAIYLDFTNENPGSETQDHRVSEHTKRKVQQLPSKPTSSGERNRAPSQDAHRKTLAESCSLGIPRTEVSICPGWSFFSHYSLNT